MQIYANKGMFIESLVEKTISYYIDNNICFLEKRHIPIKIIKNKGNNLIEGKLLNKSYVDYMGIINGKFITFETKQTNENVFYVNQLKDHQFNHLQLINKFKGISFLVIHFYKFDKTFLLSYSTIENIFMSKIKKISLEYLTENIDNEKIFILDIVFPGILNIFDVVNKMDK